MINTGTARIKNILATRGDSNIETKITIFEGNACPMLFMSRNVFVWCSHYQIRQIWLSITRSRVDVHPFIRTSNIKKTSTNEVKQCEYKLIFQSEGLLDLLKMTKNSLRRKNILQSIFEDLTK